MTVKMFGHNQLKNGVSQELEALIVEVILLGLVPETRVGQRFCEQKRISKFVAYALFQGFHDEGILPGIPLAFQQSPVPL